MSAAEFQVVFVCTGNLFRSPLAAELFRAEVAGLPVVVSSAGTLNLGAVPAEPEAVEQAALLGADLSSHRAQWLVDQDFHDADLVVGFEHAHVTDAVMKANAPSERCFTLIELVALLERQSGRHDTSGPVEHARAVVEGADALRNRSGTPTGQLEVPDPFGGPPDLAERVAGTISALTRRLAVGLFGTRPDP